MPATTAPFPNLLTPALATGALASWSVALVQALPRLLAGPLCTSRQDGLAFAGHCPACFVAAAFTLALMVHLVARFRSRDVARA